jgi:hypothetical protein
LDCPADISHKDQLSIILNCVKIKQKIFVDFLHITGSTCSGLFKVFVLSLLGKINLDLENWLGQYKYVQDVIKEINTSVFHISCANHTFKLMVYDAEKSATCEINYFGPVQRFFTFFLLHQLFVRKY